MESFDLDACLSFDDEPYLAHDKPDRPFDTMTWLCECGDCLAALRREAVARPRLALCLKTNFDRVLVTAEYLTETLRAGRGTAYLCYVADDWVREVFVPVGIGDLPPPFRWWSLTLHEERPNRAWRLKRPAKLRPSSATSADATIVTSPTRRGVRGNGSAAMDG